MDRGQFFRRSGVGALALFMRVPAGETAVMAEEEIAEVEAPMMLPALSAVSGFVPTAADIERVTGIKAYVA